MHSLVNWFIQWPIKQFRCASQIHSNPQQIANGSGRSCEPFLSAWNTSNIISCLATGCEICSSLGTQQGSIFCLVTCLRVMLMTIWSPCWQSDGAPLWQSSKAPNRIAWLDNQTKEFYCSVLGSGGHWKNRCVSRIAIIEQLELGRGRWRTLMSTSEQC